MSSSMTKSYSELMQLETYEERFNYLKLNDRVGSSDYAHERYIRQQLYKTDEWKRKRRKIIIRDNGRDLGIDGREIFGSVQVHHINPITAEDIINNNPKVWDEENLISASDLTHKAIHYSDEDILIKDPIERTKNDTCPWRK